MKIKIHPLVSGHISIHFSSKTQERDDMNKTTCWLLSKGETPTVN